MYYKFSRCIALQTDRSEEALEFYQTVLGMERADKDGMPELNGDPVRVFVDKGSSTMVVMEFSVADIEAAREDLVSKGCTVLKWGGIGEANYIRDPFGFVFNLWHDPSLAEKTTA